MRTFGTQGPVNPHDNYIVRRSKETADFIARVKNGKYIVIFAPRQTGKTTFFRAALATLTTEDRSYFPIQLDFQIQRNAAPATFYAQLSYMIRRQIKFVFQKRCDNPIYQHRILQTFKPTINGLELTYLPEDIDFTDYLSPTGHLEIAQLLDNFRDFITRAGFRILQVPDTPQEYVGQYLLYAYLDTFVRIVHGDMFLEVQTGRGRMDLLLLHNQRKYIVETKIWEGDRSYQAGKQQLSAYLKLEGVTEGYYVVFDHRQKPEPRVETETVAGVNIRSYVIPVIQVAPSNAL